LKTVYYTATSLDGFIATPDHDLTWLTSLDAGEEGAPGYGTFIAEIGALVMGSATYEWMLRNHIYLNPEAPQAWAIQPALLDFLVERAGEAGCRRHYIRKGRCPACVQ